MPRSSQIHAVVFDMDDTLYSERDYVRSGYRAVSAALREQLGRECPQADQWLWARFQRGWVGGAFDALNEHFSLGLGADDIALLVKAYREHSPEIQPYGGIADLLALLHGSYRLGLLSDGFLPAQRLKLRALKLERFFDELIFTEELAEDRKCWKPSPVGFETIADKLGAAPKTCVYIGDNPAKDFVAPNSLGWLSVQMRFPGQVHADNPYAAGGEPKAVVHSAWELHRVLVEG